MLNKTRSKDKNVLLMNKKVLCLERFHLRVIRAIRVTSPTISSTSRVKNPPSTQNQEGVMVRAEDMTREEVMDRVEEGMTLEAAMVIAEGRTREVDMAKAGGTTREAATA